MWLSQNVRHCGHDPHTWRSVLPVSWDNCWEWADGAASVAPWSDVTRWGDRPRIAVIVGPEGGIGDGELEALCAAGAQPMRLGTTVMRSSTAGPAALAALHAVLGLWD